MSASRASRITTAALASTVVCAVLLCGCAPRTAVEPQRGSRTEILHMQDLQQTREDLRKARDSLAGTSEGARAQYALAYLNVFYASETPDYDSALAEFNRFVEEYPEHEGAALARTWMRVLSSLAESARYSAVCESVSRERVRLDTLAAGLRDSTELLHKELLRATGERDSLLGRIELLEEVIETIEKNP